MKKKNDLVSVAIVTRNRKNELIECIDSYLKSTYKDIEIIVIDNGSKPLLKTWLPQKYKKLKLITNEENLGPSKGRNQGILTAKGKYILFADDDSTADKKMVEELVDGLEKNPKAGVIQPLIYSKNKKNILLGAGHDISTITGRITAWGVKEKDTGQYNGIREVPMCGCVWMINRKVSSKIGLFDEDYFIPYEDSDFCLRARKAGFKLFCSSDAKSYHPVYKKTFVHPIVEFIGITSPERAYRVARNKLIFMRKHAGIMFIPFFFILLPIYVVLHTIFIVISKRFDILGLYWRGLFSGIRYSILYSFVTHVSI